MKSVVRSYLLIDHGKFGKSALHFLTGLEGFDAVLTGAELDAAHQIDLKEPVSNCRKLERRPAEE